MTAKPMLPDFTRWAWASVEERQWWQPLFQDASVAFNMVERYSVVDGLRFACWQPVNADELVNATEWAQRHGLVCVPTHQTASTDNYSATPAPATDGKMAYRCLFMRPQQYTTALPMMPHNIGALLGYPACCQQAFEDTWAKGQVDSTWEQWNQTPRGDAQTCHTLLRWMGIRLVSHMPCQYHCNESMHIAKRFMDVGVKYGYKESMVLLEEVLNWPVEWSRLFGIAEIVTPAVKIAARTDWTPTKDQFKKQGRYNKPETWLWTDNGFMNPDAMRAAHGALINSLTDVPKQSRILDLGCGNGLLLRRLTIRRPDLKIGGIDLNPSAIAHTPKMWGHWLTGKIEDGNWADWNAKVGIISVGRLAEMSPDKRTEILGLLPKETYVYGYADTLKDESLEALTARISAGTLQMLQKTPEVSVGRLVSS